MIDTEERDPEQLDAEELDAEAEGLAPEDDNNLRLRFARIMAVLSSPVEAERLAATYALERLCEENGTTIVGLSTSLIDRNSDARQQEGLQEGYRRGWDAARKTHSNLGPDETFEEMRIRRLREAIDKLRSTVRATYAQRVAAERLQLQMEIDGLLEKIAYASNPALAQERAEREQAEREARKAAFAAEEAHYNRPQQQEIRRLTSEHNRLQRAKDSDEREYYMSAEHGAWRPERRKMGNQISFLKGQLTRAQNGRQLHPRYWTPPRPKLRRGN
jgi:hypothetical protein